MSHNTQPRAESPESECELQSSISTSSSCCSLGAMDCSVNLSPTRLEKYRTPPSPIFSDLEVDPDCKCMETESQFSNEQDDYLQFLEPFPVQAPPYSLLAPGGCPRFPIEVPATAPNEPLPEYLPSIYKIGMVSRKIEWLSPFEPSPSRLWKLIILELNSTQLNFYFVPSNLEAHLSTIQSTSSLTGAALNSVEELDVLVISSRFTSNSDLHFYKGCQRLGIFDPLRAHLPSSASSLFEEEQSPVRYKSSKKGARLIRSYSLQHAQLGLAADYLKKPNVLRIRVESEQILLHFGSTKELVEWHFALSMGRDISLDLEDRHIPRYRTVPRRRNRNTPILESTLAFIASSTPLQLSRQDSIGQFYEDPVSRGRARSNSQKSIESSAMKARLSNIRSKFRSNNTPAPPPSNDIIKGGRTTVFNVGADNTPEPIYPTNRGFVRTSSVDRDDNELIDVQNMSDLQGSDDEDEDYDDDVVAFSCSNGSSAAAKWAPDPDNIVSERKFYRNCLRCIKPLNMDELWVNKPMVKPSSLSPLNLSFLKHVKYATSTTHSSSASLASLSSSFSASLLIQSNAQKSRKKSFSFKDSFMYYSDGGLSKIPNHFVKEFTVGTTGLMAKEL
ncbi:hypothetical protein QFC19_006393 [Naganishia cerealis]|uniref:Uncharacterized protein n=1 Tax=Naganishia cerealis TaxID=610337 RepID=A0ACC2VG66_9TREE|nr:hypothetical protein QFC19_006393 [Naganishia cerealis]